MISALFRRWGLQSVPIRTARLRLVAITPEMLGAEGASRSGLSLNRSGLDLNRSGLDMSRSALGDLLHAQVPADWPPEYWESHVWAHILAQYGAAPNTFGWHRYMVTEDRPTQLVGCLGGFPCAHGDAELGYSVAESAQRRGFASEAANALVSWLLRRPEVRSVSAQAFETAPASIKVMQRCGMQSVGRGDQPGTVRYRRWRNASGVGAADS